jgi:hypothetical protein
MCFLYPARVDPAPIVVEWLEALFCSVENVDMACDLAYR